MSEKILKFGNVIVNKKEFHRAKQPISLNLVDIEKIVVSDEFKHSDKGCKYFIGYTYDNIIRPLCIVLPQMSRYIKYFDNDEKSMSFKIENDSVLVKYNEIWNKILKMLNIKLHSKPVYEEKYIKTKVKAFNEVVNIVFSDNKIPKGSIHYICIAAINIDSVIYLVYLVYLEECKDKIKKKKMVKFIDVELDLDDSDDSNDSYFE